MSTPPAFDTDPGGLARLFPADFAWGFAASAYQIEGASAEDGRGPSIWDTFARQPGAVADGSTGDIACDHYHRYPEDVRLMADLGTRAYRFSVSWSRVLPTGSGAINQRGLDFYQRLVDTLLGAGVQPLINLFHWDLPQALQDRGGFADPRIVGWFTDYTALLASNLGDRVKDWMTFNEPAVFAFLGHADGIHAPGLRDWPTAIRVADNELRAHAAAAAAIRALVDDPKIGVAIDVNQVPRLRLANVIYQRKARALLARADELFTPDKSPERLTAVVGLTGLGSLAHRPRELLTPQNLHK
jgi:beta-glucosidase